MAKRFEYDKYKKEMIERFEKVAAELEGEMENPPRTEATKDSIILSCKWGDPWNPLWSDEEYAKKTKWGGIIAMPLYTDRVDMFSYWPQLDPEGGFIDHNLYGGIWTDLKPVRPGDTFRVYQHRPQMIDIASIEGNDEPHTFGFIERDAEVYNQNNELVSRHKHILDIIVRPEAKQAIADALPFEDHVYTQAELDYIDAIIDAEVIRGADTRYYEDVTVGERLPDVTIGPTTAMDMMAYYASHEEIPVAPMRWFRRKEPDGVVLDPDTNVTHYAAEWHIITDRARMLGNPRAFHFGDSARTQMVRCVTNWMGDDAEVVAVDYRHITRTPIGDCQVGHGVVVDRYVKDGEGFAVVDTWLDNMCRGNVTEAAKITVKLPSRAPLADSAAAEPEKRAFEVGEKVRIGEHKEWWQGGNPLTGAVGEVIRLYAWDDAYANFPEYVGVRVDQSSTGTKLGIGAELMFRGEFLERI
jgi:acyl dehydratase